MPRISIELSGYGVAGWEWTETYQIMGITKTLTCRTNHRGEGLWHWRETTARDRNADGSYSPHWEYKQVLGTCQFDLPRDRKAAYNKIRRRTAAHLDFMEGR